MRRPIIADAALLRDDDAGHAPYIAAMMAPFRSGVALWRSPGEAGFDLDTVLTAPATAGILIDDLYSGPVARWDRVNAISLYLWRGEIASADQLAVLNGANVALVENEHRIRQAARNIKRFLAESQAKPDNVVALAARR